MKRFLRSMGFVASKNHLIAILRRFDMDGDAKIDMKEFAAGMKSSLSIFPNKSKRPKSSSMIGGYTSNRLNNQRQHNSSTIKTPKAMNKGFPIRN